MLRVRGSGADAEWGAMHSHGPRKSVRSEKGEGNEDGGGGGFKAWLSGFGDDEELVEDVRVYAQTLAICLLIRFFLVEPRFIPSLSMYPTFDVGDQLAVEKVSKRLRPLVRQDPFPIHRNEVVVFNPPPAFKALVSSRARDEALIKRVVAVAGDTVAVRNGVLYVNDKAQMEDDVINERPFYDMEPKVVPPGNLFVLGDNRNQSLDGHVWGFLPTDNVIGRAVFKYWPPNRLGGVVAPVGNY